MSLPHAALALLGAALLATSSVAQAGPCDSTLRKADSARGADLLAAYDRLASCDKGVAAANFPRFMMRSGDLETLVPLTLKAIDLGATEPVGKMMEKVPYDVQNDLAEAIGSACADQPSVVGFLQSSAQTLRGTGFTRWAPAHATCVTPEHTAWLQRVTARPPETPYSDKYDVMVKALIAHQGAAALPTLEAAAVAAAEAGPFPSLLDAIVRSVQPPTYGAPVPEADQAAMEQTFVRIAQQVPAEAARQVADKLYTIGAEATAASLLPTIFPDAVQSNGELLWAAAAVEQCDGEAIIHWAGVTQPAEVWGATQAASTPLRNTKARLKCDSGEWSVRSSNVPLATPTQVEAWIGLMEKELAAQGLDVKQREEKKLTL